MKKLFVSLVAVVAMMVCNPVMGQNRDSLLNAIEIAKIQQALTNACEDDNEYMADIGYATNADRDQAERDALLNCQAKLKLRLEQTVKGVVEDLSAKQELSTQDAYDAATLREINQGFQSVINKTIGHTIKCYSFSYDDKSSTKNNTIVWKAEYNAKISIEEFIRETKAAINEDATLRTKIQLDEFENRFREQLKSE